MKNKKWMRMAAVVAAGMMMVTGCGNSAGTAVQDTTQTTAQNSSDGALVIKEQGMFSAGGTTITSEGTFNPEDQWEESGEISTKTLDQRWYTQFRIGRWEDGKSVVNEGSRFPNDDASVDQFFRQMTPDTGMTSDMGADFDNETVAKAVAETIEEVYARTGKDSILVTHSQGGNCTVVDLPKEGITGNDHFMFQDLNNDVIADHVENWIQENVQ